MSGNQAPLYEAKGEISRFISESNDDNDRYRLTNNDR